MRLLVGLLVVFACITGFDHYMRTTYPVDHAWLSVTFGSSNNAL